jgi:hypothetical protein
MKLKLFEAIQMYKLPDGSSYRVQDDQGSRSIFINYSETNDLRPFKDHWDTMFEGFEHHIWLRISPGSSHLSDWSFKGLPEDRAAHMSFTLINCKWMEKVLDFPDVKVHNFQVRNCPLTTLEGIPSTEHELKVEAAHIKNFKGMPKLTNYQCNFSNLQQLESFDGGDGVRAHTLNIKDAPMLGSFRGINKTFSELHHIYWAAGPQPHHVLNLMRVKHLQNVSFGNRHTYLAMIINEHLGGNVVELQEALLDAGFSDEVASL